MKTLDHASLYRLGMFAVFGLTLLGCTPSPDFVPSPEDLVEGHFATAVPRGSHRFQTPDSLIVVSYNIQYGEHIRRAAKDLRSMDTVRNADLILLQEMDPSGTRILARALGCDFVYFPASRHPKHHHLFGNAILSRWPISSPHLALLSHEGLLSGTQRIVVLATIRWGNRGLRIANVHTTTIITPHEQRMKQLREVLRQLSKPNSTVVVGGDFNTVVKSDVQSLRDMFRRAGFHLARLPGGPTIRTKRAALLNREPVLDHILYRGLALRSTGILYSAKASDHFPIWAVFSLRLGKNASE